MRQLDAGLGRKVVAPIPIVAQQHSLHQAIIDSLARGSAKKRRNDTASWKDLLCAHNTLVTTNGLVKRMLNHDGGWHYNLPAQTCIQLSRRTTGSPPALNFSELVQTKWNELSSSHVVSSNKAPQMWNWYKNWGETERNTAVF